jgi:ferredoxin-NADP reductase
VTVAEAIRDVVTGAADSAVDQRLRLRVATAQTHNGVRSLRLTATDGRPLPSFTPGSHIVIEAGGRRNAYSLTGEFLQPTAYRISVRYEPDGHGGSRWLHERLAPGDELIVARPRSAFAPVATARHHVLIAGGIGVTPILSHVRAALLYDRSFEVIHGGTAHRRELAELCGASRLRGALGRGQVIETVRERLSDQPLGTVVYVCGPPGLIDAVTLLAAELGWPPERVQVERFSAATPAPGAPFTVALARSGYRVAVACDVTLLDALESAGVPVANMCRQGVCGECRVRVLAGTPEHRDLYLSDEERAAGDSIMCCVSRAHEDHLELDL